MIVAGALNPARSLTGLLAAVAIGLVVGLGTSLTQTLLGPKTVALVLGTAFFLMPVVVLRDARAYGLFLLVISIPFEVAKSTTQWLVDPISLYHTYGIPASGTLGLDIYPNDFIMVVLILPWLIRVCRGQARIRFPRAGFIFLLYLAWAAAVSLVKAISMYLAVFEFIREIIYFMLFLYVANNVETRLQFRAILAALLLGMLVESVIVLSFFDLGVGTETNVFGSLLSSSQGEPATTLPVAEAGSEAHVARSAGTFVHPAHTAYYFGFILPVVLGAFLAARRLRQRILYGASFVIGSLALVVTFSRAGLTGFVASLLLMLPAARWSRLISHRSFVACVFLIVVSTVGTVPLLMDYLDTRPEATAFRWKLIDAAIETYRESPIFGAGLNNSSAATKGSLAILPSLKGTEYRATVVHNFYLIVLIEVGAVGFLLFFGFFGAAALTGIRWMRTGPPEQRGFLIGFVAALAGTAVHNLADPFGPHVAVTHLWLYTGLIFAACYHVKADGALPQQAKTRPRNSPSASLSLPAPVASAE